MFSKLALVAGAAALLATGPAWADGFTLKAPPKVAFLFFKAKNDGGWTQAFEEARVKMEKALGMQIPYVENIAEDRRPDQRRQPRSSSSAATTSSSAPRSAIRTRSRNWPPSIRIVAFLNAAGTTNGPNLQSFYGRTYESQYLCGMVAGGVSKSGKLGFVGANPFGIVNWTVNAYELGAAEAQSQGDRDGGLHRRLERSGEGTRRRRGAGRPRHRRDRPACRHADGADRGPGAQDPRHRPPSRPARVRAEGDAVLVRLGLGQIPHPEIKKIAAGNWVTSPYGDFISIKDGGTDIACCSADVPKDVVDKVMAARQEIIDGKQHVYAGPIKDRDGKERVPAGQVISDADLWKMDWYVPGVITQKK